MKQLDELEPAWRDEIEKELERRLAVRRPTNGSSRRAQDVAPLACLSCGTMNDLDARFCKQCGSHLRSEGAQVG
jgi:hypothetical protein